MRQRSGKMYDVRCTMYDVRWTMDDGRCTMYDGRWTIKVAKYLPSAICYP
ncbi:MAG: hypothetical protein ACOYM0_11435 [Bacteroidales bacterium]